MSLISREGGDQIAVQSKTKVEHWLERLERLDKEISMHIRDIDLFTDQLDGPSPDVVSGGPEPGGPASAVDLVDSHLARLELAVTRLGEAEARLWGTNFVRKPGGSLR